MARTAQCAPIWTRNRDERGVRCTGGHLQAYLRCLYDQVWPNLERFVTPDVLHNGRAFGLTGYYQILEADFRAIPDLHFQAEKLAVTPHLLASRQIFDCTPVGELFGLQVNGQRLRFHENVFYRFVTIRTL